MNNLYRDLAPVTEEAWEEIEVEATRTFKRHIAGRRVVDVSEPGGPMTASVSTGSTARCQSTRRRRGHPSARKSNRLCGFGFRSHCHVPRSTTWNAVRKTPIGIRSKPPPRSWLSSRTAPSSRVTPPRRSRASELQQQPTAETARRPARNSRHHHPGADRTAAGRCRRPVLGAAVRRRLHQSE